MGAHNRTKREKAVGGRGDLSMTYCLLIPDNHTVLLVVICM